VETINKPIFLQSSIRDVNFGVGVKVVEPVNLYECSLGNHCFVGPFVEIQSGVKIGGGTKIQSHSLVCELVEIGQDCFIGHGVMFINDPFLEGGPAHGNRDLWRYTHIGDNVSIGSNATILPVTVCDNAVIGAGAVVTKDILNPGVYAGNPAHKISEYE